jgi:hypothetical protein
VSKDQAQHPGLVATVSDLPSNLNDVDDVAPTIGPPLLPLFIDEFDPVELEELRGSVPIQYHYGLDLFQHKAATETLPPTREYDMRINLKPNASLPVAKLYQLTEEEKSLLKRSIAKLQRGAFDQATRHMARLCSSYQRKTGSYVWWWTIEQ